MSSFILNEYCGETVCQICFILSGADLLVALILRVPVLGKHLCVLCGHAVAPCELALH